MRELTFVIPNLPKVISLDIRESEFLYNAMVVTNLAANLVTQQSDGKFVPAMAESWEIQGNSWSFKIREGFECQDGEPITAAGFRRSFLRTMAALAKKHDVPVFDKLVGFNEFIKGNRDSLGIHATGNKLIFDFTEVPKRGFIEYLAFPTLGYACDANYKNGEWVNPESIISSGPFELESLKQGDEIILRRRAKWYRDIEVDKVRILSRPTSEIPDKNPLTILIGEDLPNEKPGFNLIKEVPQTLGSAIVKPVRDLADVQLRQQLLDKVIEVRERTPLQTKLATRARAFFTAQEANFVARPAAAKMRVPSHPLKILAYAPVMMTPTRRYAEEVTLRALDEMGWKYEIDRPENRTMDVINSPKYDLKFYFAEVGAAVEEWVVDMHFAAYLGGQFIDPSGRVTKATKDFREKKISYDAYVKEFNQALYDDATVLPLVHMGKAWLVSEDIDHIVTPVMTLPKFDEVRLVK